MALTIVATAGAAEANSFVSAAEMTAYCEARLNASMWTAAAAQLPALVEATRDISLLRFAGERAAGTQALAWPRSAAPDPDAPAIDGAGGERPGEFDAGEIPQRVKDATCELALQYVKAGTADVAALDGSIGVVRKKVDVLETEYARPHERARGLARFPRVMAYLAPLLHVGASGGLQVVRT
ncbi:MAG: hypothetical protein H0X64_08185 [Gemmatimonadaceae bacterium]|nr:hypothetical protein [Gemmatimonadaceae bacterium]